MANPWDNDQVVNPAQGGGQVFTLPNDPIAVATDQAQLTRLNQQIRDANKPDAPPPGYRWRSDGGLEPVPGGPQDPKTLSQVSRPQLSANERANAIAAFNASRDIDRLVADIEGKYASGPGATKGLAGLKDYLPTTANDQFDKAGNALRGYVGTALGFTGGQLNTATEAEQSIGPYLPKASDRDATILDKIQRLRDLANSARTRSTAILGGVPDANGQVTPVQQGRDNQPIVGFSGAGGNIGGPGTPTFDPSGNTPTPEDKRFSDMMNAAMRGGASFDMLNQMSVAAGRGPLSDEHRQFIQTRDSGAPVANYQTPTSGRASELATRAAETPLGSAALNYLDFGGFGIPRALAGNEAFDAASQENPLSSLAGGVAGAITGTSLLGRGGTAATRAILGSNAPRVLQGGGRLGMFARNLATDAAYGGAYGGVTEGDPLGGAAAAAAGSVLGQGLGSGIGKAIGGTRSAASQALRDLGVNRQTTGQILGGPAKSLEDALTSVPGISDLIGARRLEGLNDFNQAAFDRITGQPLGDTGTAGLTQARNQISGPGGMYETAVQGANVPLDPQSLAEIAAARTQGAALPDDLAARFDLAMRNRVDPVVQGGSMTGEQFQQVNRGLKGYRNETTKPGFEQEYRDALGSVDQALRGAMERGGGRSVTEGLSAADAAYRRLKTVEDAVNRARNGSRSGEVETFTPSQLGNASARTSQRFGSGALADGPYYDLASAGQRVLPSSLPDSGTARRVATLALPGILGGGGYALDKTDLTDNATASGLALGAILAAGGTRAGQKAINAIVSERPDALKTLGSKVGKRKGMFGSALAPLFIEDFTR